MKLSTSRRRATIIGIILTLLFFWLKWANNQFTHQITDRIDYIIYDLQTVAHLPENPKPDNRILIIDIDSRSLQAEGQWPWSRKKLSGLINKLFDAGAVVIAFDIFFSEPEHNRAHDVARVLKEKNSPPDLVRQVESLADEFDYDSSFAEAISNGEVVLGYYFEHEARPPTGAPPGSGVKIPAEALKTLQVHTYQTFTSNIPILAEASIGHGAINSDYDLDGAVRKYPIVSRYKDKIYPSLALETVKTFFLNDSFELDIQQGFLENIKLSDRSIPVDNHGLTPIPFRGPARTFRYISATDIFNNQFDARQIDGTIVLVGATAIGLEDLRPTPVDKTFPGVEIHANLIAGILDLPSTMGVAQSSLNVSRPIPYTPDWSEGAVFALIFILGVLLAVLMPRLNPTHLSLVTILSVGGILGFNYMLLSAYSAIVSMTIPVMLVLALAFANIGHGFIFEHRSKAKLKNRFGEYIPSALVDEMADHPELVNIENENREMSVLFADIRSFTTISETLDAGELKQLLNRFFTPMTRIIFEHRGTIDKYVGDMIMAFWNAPLDDPQHPQNAVEAALEMLQDLKKLQAEFEAEGFPYVDIGIGINTGEMSVGDMGSEYRRAYTVIGDAVNLGSRLEGLTKFYGVNLVISESTLNYLDGITCRKLDLVKVKGKTSGVTVYCPICHDKDATPELLDELQRHHLAVDLYLKQEWDKAEEIFTKLQQEHPDTKLYPLYIERISNLRKRKLPADWDGVFERREK